MTTSLSDRRCSADAQPRFDAADYDYRLPPEYIAQQPLPDRAASRLLFLDRVTGEIQDRGIRDLPELLAPGDLLVFNDTRVIPARVHGRKETGGRVEMLLERVLSPHRVLAQLRANHPPAIDSTLRFGTLSAEVEGREGRFWVLRFPDDQKILEWFGQHGQTPLPPYIRRAAEGEDRERYQTVYAREAGAVAAPTAGLHFDDALLTQLDERGVAQAFVTLHVGAGTFQPIEADDIREHQIHAEYMTVDAAVCEKVRQTQASGGRVIAVGTTSVRALEAAAAGGEIEPYAADTQLYLYPGQPFRVVDAMVTNFHLPKSSLLVLVCAFAGRDSVLAAYSYAIAERYRFYSYGDAMLIL